jgi:hypothetical protein
MDGSKRNRYAGKGKNKRAGSNKATGRDYSYDKAYQASPERKKYRARLNRVNRERGTYGNGDNKDASHKKDGSIMMEHKSRNRARNGHNGKSTKL